MTLLPDHGRFEYRPITRRPDWRWPNGARLAFYIGFNVEHFAFGQGLGATLGPATPPPDVLNYSWREYGNRVGVWRCLELFDQLALPLGALVNTALYDHCPEVVAALVARGDELIGHGHTNAERQGGWPEADEAAILEQAPGLPDGDEARVSRRKGCRQLLRLLPQGGQALHPRAGERDAGHGGRLRMILHFAKRATLVV